VVTYAAAYYKTDASGVDAFISVVLLVGMPLAIVSTWLTKKLGLR
jgi:hypothetical protein